MKRLTLLLAFVLLGTALALAQLPKPENVVRVRVEPPEVTAKVGASAALLFVADIQKGFHVNSNKPTLDYLIPTRVELLGAEGFTLEKADFPPGELKAFGFAPDDLLSVYEGTIRVPLKLRAGPEATRGVHSLRFAFHYQACNDLMCLRPAKRETSLQVKLQ